MASNLVGIEVSPGQTVYFQADPDLRLQGEGTEPSRGLAAGRLPSPEDIGERFEQLAQYVAQRSEQFIHRFRDVSATFQPQKVALEFTVGIEGSCGIPFLAAGKGTANMTITAEWSP
jgi:hypothetical protein